MFAVFSSITSRQKIFLLIWVRALLALGISVGRMFIKLENDNLQASIKKHMAHIHLNVTESGNSFGVLLCQLQRT